MKDNAKKVTREEARKMSEEELDAALEQKYGSEWSLADLARSDPLTEEFYYRIRQGT